MDRRQTLKSIAGTAALAAMPGAARAQTLIPLKVGTLKQASLTVVWVAQQAGIFEKNGLKVELIEFRNGNEAISAQRGKFVDIVLAIPGSIMVAVERGFDLVVLSESEKAKGAPPDSGSMQVLADSPIKSIKDLVGKRIGVGNLNSQMHVAVNTVLRKNGVDPKQAQFSEVPFSSQFDVLKGKQIDVAAVLDPWTTQMRGSGLTRTIGWHYVESVPEQPIGWWVATRPYAEANKEACTKFGTAIKEAVDYMRADADRARKNVSAYTGLSLDLMKEMPINNWDSRVNLVKWQEVIDMMRENGALEKPWKAKQFVSEFIKPYIVS
jgi:NitT/TauT family transport system substrate-binding protein